MLFQHISISAAAALVSLLVNSASAHMKIATPIPFNAANLDNSPLNADGTNFPCKFTGSANDILLPSTGRNVMAIGDTQTLSFIGSAVHGGGSCQISLTSDLYPSKNTKWMVIKSIEGGCPASTPGNLPADPNGDGASKFQYQIPSSIIPGEYTFAWTWINKIGNREFYMNCAPITVTAPKKKRYAPAPVEEEQVSELQKRASFPDMFVANLAGINTCTTPETFDYYYPNPGAVVQLAGTGPYTTLTCAAATGNEAAQSPTVGAGAAAAPSGSGSGSSSSAAAAAPQVTSSSSSPQSIQPGVFASGAASSVASSVATTAAQAPPAAAPTATATAIVSPLPQSSGSSPAPVASSGGSSPSSSGATTHTAGAACSSEGMWSCAANGSSFQRCASGQWSASMQMATGMQCTPGDSSTLNMSASKMKRRADVHSHARRLGNLFRRSSHL